MITIMFIRGMNINIFTITIINTKYTWCIAYVLGSDDKSKNPPMELLKEVPQEGFVH